MRYIDADELSQDILDGEIEITGEGSDFAIQAVHGYKSAILRRIMAQPTENVIPVEFVETMIDETRKERSLAKEGSMEYAAFEIMISTWERLILTWEKVKDEWLHKEGGEP